MFISTAGGYSLATGMHKEDDALPLAEVIKFDGQDVQDDNPANAWYVPTAQGVQLLLPCDADTEPAGHSVHALAPAAE